MNRPERFNALSFQVMREWSAILDELESDLDTRVAISRGSGIGFLKTDCGVTGTTESVYWVEL